MSHPDQVFPFVQDHFFGIFCPTIVSHRPGLWDQKYKIIFAVIELQ